MKSKVFYIVILLTLILAVGCGRDKRLESNPEIAIDTNFGTIELELYRDVAPVHVDSMLARVRQGFYNSLTFHRIIKGYVMQGGDPRGNGTGSAGYKLRAEFSDLPHVRGTLSAVRGNDYHSASCQFFICFQPAPALNGQYTVFGMVLDGFEVLDEIEQVPVTQAPFGREESYPTRPVDIKRIRILKDVSQ